MRAWIILAWKEFWLPFHYRKSGCPGGRDFVWLTIFMALLLTLILLLMASQEGLLNRFVDVLLGNVAGYGVPISVTNNMLSRGGINAINQNVLDEVRTLGTGPDSAIPGLTIFPYRLLEASLRPLVELPDEQIWQNRQQGGSKVGPDFDGWAVSADNPLWNAHANDKPFPLKIVVNRSLFFKYFDYQRYRSVLQAQLPSKFFAMLPEHLDPTLKKPLSHLWMRVTLGLSKELLPFTLDWVERFPVIDKIAYVFPMTTYHALNVAFDFPDLRYFPEFHGEANSRIKQIHIQLPPDADSSSSEPPAIYKQFAAAFNADIRSFRGDLLLTFPSPIRSFWLDAYKDQYDITYRVTEAFQGDALAHDAGALLLPCHRLPDDVLRDLNVSDCSEETPQTVRVSVTSRGNGFHHALVYVPDRTLLSQAVEELRTVSDSALAIHPFYQDALNRFGFLSKMLQALRKPYTWFLVLFLFALLSIQIGSLIGHRRHRYGVFLAKGMQWWQIYCSLWFQILLAQLLGMGIAWLMIGGARKFLQSAIQTVAFEYADTLSLADLNLLPLSTVDSLMVAGAVYLLAWGLVTAFLWALPLRRRTYPASLLH